MPHANTSTTLTPRELRSELLTHPLMLSVGSLSLSTFMSRAIYGVVDWRPVLICVSSDILAIGMDHYFDQAPMLTHALKTGNAQMRTIFRKAKVLLLSSASLLIFALTLSPPSTWAMVSIFFGPAFVWDFNLFMMGGRQRGSPKTTTQKKAFRIKRIPGTKALLIGVIRGCGTFYIVRSVLGELSSSQGHNLDVWNPSQIVIWSTINRACHAVMADVRDFHEDWVKQVPTIPVLLKSVFRTKVLLTVMHLLTMVLYANNPYIVFSSIYATVLVWYLDESSPRGLYRLSFHSQTLTALLYAFAEAAKQYSLYQSI
ncbi:hypothetical protein K466DRAFT_668406 [Polyporus arcularius HHB13444]|uniref:UbiA prenyltransferase n=1 Tax=Polyporus arcularius HHB13444 TaxID=1314778 RepID=A0A5C3NPD3_9APHY|nr:hypothetical protein K466DRAFT_668406 [Polyporus arcularius HHB13444]